MIKKIRAVAIGDVLAVAQDIFKSEKLNLAIIGQYKNKEQFENLLRI